MIASSDITEHTRRSATRRIKRLVFNIIIRIICCARAPATRRIHNKINILPRAVVIVEVIRICFIFQMRREFFIYTSRFIIPFGLRPKHTIIGRPPVIGILFNKRPIIHKCFIFGSRMDTPKVNSRICAIPKDNVVIFGLVIFAVLYPNRINIGCCRIFRPDVLTNNKFTRSIFLVNDNLSFRP